MEEAAKSNVQRVGMVGLGLGLVGRGCSGCGFVGCSSVRGS